MSNNDGSRAAALMDRFEDYSSSDLLRIITGAVLQLAQRQGTFSAVAEVTYLLEGLEPRSAGGRH